MPNWWNRRGRGRSRRGARPNGRAHNGHAGNGSRRRAGVVRYGVVGLGHIAQVAVLPAFAHAGDNSRLVALVSDDGTKLKALSKKG